MNAYDPNYIPTYAHFLLGVKTLVINKSGKILLLRRSDKVSRPHGWDFPGGGVDKGENPLDAAMREIKEETNLAIDNLRLMTTYLTKTDNEDDLIIGYAGMVDDEPSIELTGWEHDDFQWVTLDELEEIQLPKEHRAIVDTYKFNVLDRPKD